MKFYGMQARQEIYSDFLSHLWLIEFYEENGRQIFPPLYYLSVQGLEKLMPSGQTDIYVAGFILVVFSLSKLTLIYFYLGKNQTEKFILIAFLSLGLFLFFPYFLFAFEGEYWYMGKFTPNIWHNCTSTFVWPFCFMLFWEGLKWLREPKNQSLFWMGFWTILILLSKPSFLFAFIPVFPIMAWIHQKKLNPKPILFSVGIFLALIVLKEIIYTNSLDQLIYARNEKHQVVFAPFAVYKLYSQTPLLEFLASFTFPIFAFALFGKQLIRESSVQFSLLLAIVSLLVYLLFAELGYRFPDANFYWQIPITLSLLYLSIIKQLVQPSLKSVHARYIDNWKYGVLSFIFIAHVISGIHYLHRYIETRIYL